MRQSVTEFLNGAGNKSYRELIQHLIRRQSTAELQKSVIGETHLLPEELQPMVKNYIDQTNERFTYDQTFWSTADCRQAFEQIIQVAINFLPIKERISALQSAFKIENQELAFKLFQIPTLSFAFSASIQRKQRKFMGIKKGIFE